MTVQQSDNSLQITRVIQASPESVYNAWVDPELRKQWWCAAPGMICDLCEIDATVGGRYRINMRNEEGQDHIVIGAFTELTPHTRIAFTWRWESWRDNHEDALVTLDLSPSGDATQLTLTHTNLPDAHAAEEHGKGWTGCLETLVTLFKTQ